MMQLFNWFRRRSLERGLDRELQYHFDRRVADLTAIGIPESDARRRVADELGLAHVREEVRDVWRVSDNRDLTIELTLDQRAGETELECARGKSHLSQVDALKMSCHGSRRVRTGFSPH